MNKFIETEVKIYVPDLDAIAARLVAAGAELESGRVLERNVRYENEEQTLTGRGIVVRLREDTRVRLTYKDPGVVKSGSLERFEAEVTVDDFNAMDVILRRLGYQPFIIYEKYRTTYTLGEAEIVLDEMPYGHFIEIEGPQAVIEETLKILGLENKPRIPASYLSLFTHVKAALDLHIHDLTFTNFDGITVPPEVFADLS